MFDDWNMFAFAIYMRPGSANSLMQPRSINSSSSAIPLPRIICIRTRKFIWTRRKNEELSSRLVSFIFISIITGIARVFSPVPYAPICIHSPLHFKLSHVCSARAIRIRHVRRVNVRVLRTELGGKWRRRKCIANKSAIDIMKMKISIWIVFMIHIRFAHGWQATRKKSKKEPSSWNGKYKTLFWPANVCLRAPTERCKWVWR